MSASERSILSLTPEADISFRTALPTGVGAGMFSRSPVAIAMGLKDHPFNLIVPKDVRINKRRNIVALELHFDDIRCIDTLLAVTKLGKFTVTCTEPSSEKICSGVINPIELGISDSELMNVLSSSLPILRVTRLSKFNKEKTINKKEPSTSVLSLIHI